MRLKDRVIIATGAAGYVGQVLTTRLAREGAHVVACDVRDMAGVAERLRQDSDGGDVFPLQVDVTSEGSTREMARQTVERYGRIDGLLNNAGLFLGPGMEARSIVDVDLEAWDRTFAVNVKGPFLCTRAVFPYMRDQGSGKIINIGSGSWLHTSRGRFSTPHYSSSKAAVTGLTRALARELGAAGITINTLAPGTMPLDARDHDPATLPGAADRALGRVGVPADIEGTMVYLFSEDSNFVTGQMIVVNGGAETW
jgi:NAD(P)-dependent dehydrogenase (short-subunit alcohol dehydrogenase family)